MKTHAIGIIGLGVMGRNLLLNMADHGFSVAGHDKDLHQIEALRQENREIYATQDLSLFIDSLPPPRTVMMLVPAGAPVDSVIQELLPFLQPNDLVIDGGNSYFKDSDLRAGNLKKKGIHFLGVGISGGESGARVGPSLMPGGPQEAYERVRPIFEAVAAKVDGEPCATWLGPGSAGHFVKMVHNGIEYGVMQLLAESYDLMKRGLGYSDDKLVEVYAQWNRGVLNSYLVEITQQIFAKQDPVSGNRLIDEILDVAKQKGTGMWTSQCAMEFHVPIPTIDIAVAMRDLSTIKREQISQIYNRPIRHMTLNGLERALHIAIILTYVQGFNLLSASKFHLNLEAVARIWRGGCIIRAALLTDICRAFSRTKDLLLDPDLSQTIQSHQEDLRSVVCQAAEAGIPVPGLMASLSYFDACRSQWLPANLIQAQRDYFGAHTYERIDSKGTFHTDWEYGN